MPLPDKDEIAAATERVERAVELLEGLRDDFRQLALVDSQLRQRLTMAAGQVARPGPWAKRQLAKAARRRRVAEDRAFDDKRLSKTGIRVERSKPVFQTPLLKSPEPLGQDELHGAEQEQPLREPRTCYVCKADFDRLHHFYDQMCSECAELNWDKREQTADLRGRTALVTGARVKIGYQCAIKLLRAGAHVIVTTRFPADAAARYAAEADFTQWGQRLEIFGLDLRHTPSVEEFCRHLLGHLSRLDFIINNACQTVRRPPGFYNHMMVAEGDAAERSDAQRPLLASYDSVRGQVSTGLWARHRDDELGESLARSADRGARSAGMVASAALSQVALLNEDLESGPSLFPRGQLDADLQQVDLRGRNSWRLAMHEVSAVELLEVHLVNAVAPFILNARLKPLMLRHPSRDKHIVNVSAMEGQFYRRFKTDKHPHTNMAKASLNMMTRTSAADYIKDGIHMNAVDTGWVTDEDPVEIATRKTEVHGFHPPLDIVDGAARICDPIFAGLLTGEHLWGQFLKDYRSIHW